VSPAEKERVRAWVRRTRAAQGLPGHLEDPGLLAELAADVLEQDTDDQSTRTTRKRTAS
jgi:hypothetical protein